MFLKIPARDRFELAAARAVARCVVEMGLFSFEVNEDKIG